MRASFQEISHNQDREDGDLLFQLRMHRLRMQEEEKVEEIQAHQNIRIS